MRRLAGARSGAKGLRSEESSCVGMTLKPILALCEPRADMYTHRKEKKAMSFPPQEARVYGVALPPRCTATKTITITDSGR